MTTDELIENIKHKQAKISDVMLGLFKNYGWEITQTTSDIKAKTEDGYTMKIDDGTCPDIIGATIHIYANDSKIFEGSLETPEEVVLLMKMLGFEKINSECKSTKI